ncbi:MAG: class I SAM-dependent methyltransferase [Acidobacteriota bacterium]|nr:class I SAM-dependent methyltransferase [Acidobacteriota bacterium]
MRYREAVFAWFGFRAGAAGFLRHGFTPGFRAAASALLQPVNSYTRFPEYHFFERDIADFLEDRPGGGVPPLVLDVGSPKLFGFYLARRHPVDLLLTDISPLALDPYEKAWEAIRRGARGRVSFGIRDARRLSDRDGTFDVVYAMSVLEHVEGDDGDSAAAGEKLRVLKPGGLLVFSVPIGPDYREQAIQGLAHAVERTGKSDLHFFQRIYDSGRFENRLRRPLGGRIEREKIRTIDRRPSDVLRGYHFFRRYLPEGLAAALGPLNPVASAAFNRDHPGLVEPAVTVYGPVHRFGDIYADAILSGRKAAEP